MEHKSLGWEQPRSAKAAALFSIGVSQIWEQARMNEAGVPTGTHKSQRVWAMPGWLDYNNLQQELRLWGRGAMPGWVEASTSTHKIQGWEWAW